MLPLLCVVFMVHGKEVNDATYAHVYMFTSEYLYCQIYQDGRHTMLPNKQMQISSEQEYGFVSVRVNLSVLVRYYSAVGHCVSAHGFRHLKAFMSHLTVGGCQCVTGSR